MNTTTFLLKYWHVNYPALLMIIGITVFHFTTNGNRLTHKSPRIFLALIFFILVTISPLDYLSNSYLFSAHMVQHIVLLLIIPPLLLTGTDENFLENVFRRRFLRMDRQLSLLSAYCMDFRCGINVCNAYAWYEYVKSFRKHSDHHSAFDRVSLYLACFHPC